MPFATTGDLADARRLIESYGWNATAYQILNPGILRWFSEPRDAVVGFVESGGYRVVAGSPICSPARLGAVLEEFEAATRGVRLSSCYFAADERLARHLQQRGPYDRILLGAQPVWQPSEWPNIVASKSSLRAQLHRARNKGVVVEQWPAERAEGHPELQRCLAEWLTTRGLPPLHFLVEPETLGRLEGRRIFVARQRGVALQQDGVAGQQDGVVGFLVASPVPQRNGWLIEQIVRGHKAANGTAELLVDAAWRYLADAGYSWVTLGLSPLSKRANLEPSQHLWLRFLLGWVRAHGRRFYNFDGLDAFKAKFVPSAWEPIWAITSERRVGLGTLWAISGAFGQASPPRLLAAALWRAAGKEVEWIRQRGTQPHRLS